MPKSSLAKSIYDLAGILAACLTVLGCIQLILHCVFLISCIGGDTPGQQITLLILAMIPTLLLIGFALLIALACRRWSKRCDLGSEKTEQLSFQPYAVFTLASGLVGMLLIILVAYHVLHEGGERMASGLAVDNTAIPFAHFIDLGIYLTLGLTLFFRPQLAYVLWTRFGGGASCRQQSGQQETPMDQAEP